MMISNDILNELKTNQYKWLITGVAGFIGSNILETLLNLNQKVIGVDNFSTGSASNLESVETNIDDINFWNNFSFFELDINDMESILSDTSDIDFILHQAALGSVPRSIEDPINTNHSNITGHLTVLNFAKKKKISKFIYAASSSTYGDHPGLPKKEDIIGNPLSPYAVTKRVNEMYSNVFSDIYNINTVGLRYFNVYGKRQNPNGAYAAVIPRWINSILNNENIYINGDGMTSRDFCYIDNVVQANINAALKKIPTNSSIFNIACGKQTTLNELSNILFKIFETNNINTSSKIVYREERVGDVRHSLADISRAKKILGYIPYFHINDGLTHTVQSFIDEASKEDYKR